MAEKSEYYEKQVIAYLEQVQDVTTIEDICAFSGICSTSTFYNHNLDKSKEIKELLLRNRRKEYAGAMRDLKHQSRDGNSTATIALLKLNGTDEERERLSNRTDVRADVRADVDAKSEVFMGFDPKAAVKALMEKGGEDAE